MQGAVRRMYAAAARTRSAWRWAIVNRHGQGCSAGHCRAFSTGVADVDVIVVGGGHAGCEGGSIVDNVDRVLPDTANGQIQTRTL